MDATTSPLTETERGWLGAQLLAAAQFLADYGSDRFPPGLEAYDHAWASWTSRQEIDPQDPNPVIDAIGVMFGQRLVDGLDGFDWVIAADENGTDLAILGLPGAGDVLIYPANLIAKRYVRQEKQFLSALHAAMVAELNALRSQAAG